MSILKHATGVLWRWRSHRGDCGAMKCWALFGRDTIKYIHKSCCRRREESVELRAILAARFERRAQASNSPRPDSGQWSGAHSDDEGSWSDLDEELSLERQCRQLKSHVQCVCLSLQQIPLFLFLLSNPLLQKSNKKLILKATIFWKFKFRTLSRTVAERNAEIERLENRLLDLASTKVIHFHSYDDKKFMDNREDFLIGNISLCASECVCVCVWLC